MLDQSLLQSHFIGRDGFRWWIGQIPEIKHWIQNASNNGWGQRYKVRIRFNLVDDLNAEFIASVSKDYRNFVKYLPEQDREQIKAEIKDIMRGVKLKYGVQPYIGKFHETPAQGTNL